MPVHERSRLIGLTFSGIQLGNMVATLLGGHFCSLTNTYNYSFMPAAWSLNFYFFGLIGLVWTCAFYFLGSDSPESNRLVSKRERDYLSEYLVKPPSAAAAAAASKRKTPWAKILTSRIVLTLNLCCFCYNWGLYLYLTQIPSYIRDVLKFDVKSVSVFILIKFYKIFNLFNVNVT